MRYLLLLLFYCFSCSSDQPIQPISNNAYRVVRTVTYQNTNVQVIIDKPTNNEVDVLITYHGTVQIMALYKVTRWF
ncbi:MAG: hypothetical protein ACK4K1_08030 [Flavobacterium sp.]